MTAGMKKTQTLRGILLRPLTVGSKAVIVHAGKITRTAQITAIHRRTAEKLCFETADTMYYLLTGPDRQPAVSLFPVALAA